MLRDSHFAGWFCGPNGENSTDFAAMLQRIYSDYVYWRRNYFPQDGYIVSSRAKRESEPFRDAFEDKLTELLARLKTDYPFHSPRYVGHMIAEQTLPSIAGMIAGLFYNPNNVSIEAAPVTVELELEVSKMIADMVGYGESAWAHLTSGGTVANIEALWIARSCRFLPFVVRDVSREFALGLPEAGLDDRALFKIPPARALQSLQDAFMAAVAKSGSQNEQAARVLAAFRSSEYNVVERGLSNVCQKLGSEPILIAPETAHYSIEKCADLLGIGRRSIVSIPVDSEFRTDVKALEAALDDASEKQQAVIAVVAVVGTTEEGAIDPIDAIASLRTIREQEGKGSFWLHADAAYGGYLRTMTIPQRVGLGDMKTTVKVAGDIFDIDTIHPPQGACDALEALGACDSVTIDPHKLGYVPFPAGAVCFANDLVKPLVRQTASYISDSLSGPNEERRTRSVGLYALEGSKPGAVAAGVWLSHTLIPLDNTGHGLLMQETIRSACEFYTLATEYPRLRGAKKTRCVPLCVPGSNIVCYAFVPIEPGVSLRQVNEANRMLYDHVSFDNRVDKSIHEHSFFVSKTVLHSSQYRTETVATFLNRLGVTQEEYEKEGVFLLRSVFMNPWYSAAKLRNRYFISELVEELYVRSSKAYETLS